MSDYEGQTERKPRHLAEPLIGQEATAGGERENQPLVPPLILGMGDALGAQSREGGTMIKIEPASPNDLPAVLELLRRAGLPIDGLATNGPTAVVAREGETVVGSAMLEPHGKDALLRSVAVDERIRGHGLGGRLVQEGLAMARDRSIRTVYLLTETADGFFARFGFRIIRARRLP